MATKKVNFHSQVYKPVVACQNVYLCLSDAWEANTVDGTKFVLASVEPSFRLLDGAQRNSLVDMKYSARKEEKIQYPLNYDDAQLKTGFKDIPCSAIEDIITEPCLVEELIELKISQVNVNNTATGVYTTIQSDFGKYVRVDSNITLLNPVAADVGSSVTLFNTSTGIVTISSAATLNGPVVLQAKSAVKAVVVAAGVYDLIIEDHVTINATATGAYTTIITDFGKHVQVDDDVTLFAATATDIGKTLTLFNTDGSNHTITVDGAGTLNGSATLVAGTGVLLVVTAAGTYDRIG